MKKINPIYLIPVAVVGLIIFFMSVKVIDAGMGGVKFTLGKISKNPIQPGLRIIFPLAQRLERWNVKTQEVKQTANVPSSEGLIVGLDVSVLFRTPVDNIVGIRKTIGRNYGDIILIPNVRDEVRSVVSGYEVKALYSEQGRIEIAEKMLNSLKEKMEAKGIIIENVLLRDVKLPATFGKSIENKLKLEQEALQKKFELEKAQKDAEIEVARARGVAESNEIIAGSITENYLRYLFVQGLQDGNSERIYIPTEANMPIFEARGN